jgi:hypothetical protein
MSRHDQIRAAVRDRRNRSRAWVVVSTVALIVTLLPGVAWATVTSTQVPEDSAIPSSAHFYTGDEDAGRVFTISGSSVHEISEIIGGTLTFIYDFGTADGYYYESAFAADGGYVYWSTNGTIWVLDPDNVAGGKTSVLSPGCGSIYSLAIDGTDLYFSCYNDNTIRHADLVPGTSTSNVTTVYTAGGHIVDLAYRQSDGALFYLSDGVVTRVIGGTPLTVISGPTSGSTEIAGIDVGADGMLYLARNGSSGGAIVESVVSETYGETGTVYSLPGYTGAYAYGQDFVAVNGTLAGAGDVVGYYIAASSPTANVFEMTGAIPSFTTTPSAPTGVSATAGDGQLSVSFTLGFDGGSAVTDVEYQVDGGSWVSSGSTSSPVTISGLTNATTYSVAVRAVNAIGDGAASTPVDGTPVAPRSTPTTTTPASCDDVADTGTPCDTFTDTGGLDVATRLELGRVEQAGVFVGYADGSFGMDDPLVRYQAILVLLRTHTNIFGEDTPPVGDMFGDFTGDEIAIGAARLRSIGVLYGVGSGDYAPFEQMRVDHWALALERLAVLDGVTLPTGDTALERLVAAGWLPSGLEAGDPITRLDVAISIARLAGS